MARIPKLDAAGKFLAADVNAQIDARAKAATAPLLDGKRGVEATELGTEHLDTVTTPGTYTQSANLEATLETGYPMTRGGVLQVERSVSKTMVWQTYTTYAPTASTPPQTWQRGSYNGTWTPWVKVGGSVAPGEVKVFATLADAKAWQALNPSAPEPVYLDGSTVTPTDPAPGDADTTGPTGAAVAVSGVSVTSYTVTVSGAVDVETGLHATAPYAFSKDGGATWTAWQASPSYTFSGLTASTDYPAPKVKVRNQSSTPDESVFTASTAVRTSSGVSFQAAVSDPAATFVWNMDDAGGTTLAQTGTDTANAPALAASDGRALTAGSGMVGYAKSWDRTATGAQVEARVKGAAYQGKTALTVSAVASVNAGTAYGAQIVVDGFCNLWIESFNKLSGWVWIGGYADWNKLTVSGALPYTSWAALKAAGPQVVHLRWAANPDEISVWHQGKKVGTATYAAWSASTGKTSPNVIATNGDALMRVAGSLDGSLNGLRVWVGQSLTDAEILSHAQAAGVA